MLGLRGRFVGPKISPATRRAVDVTHGFLFRLQLAIREMDVEVEYWFAGIIILRLEEGFFTSWLTEKRKGSMFLF